MEAPDNNTMASLLMAISGAGAVTNLKTTALISAEDGIDALRNASNVNYSPPQG